MQRPRQQGLLAVVSHPINFHEEFAINQGDSRPEDKPAADILKEPTPPILNQPLHAAPGGPHSHISEPGRHHAVLLGSMPSRIIDEIDPHSEVSDAWKSNSD